MDDDAMTRAGMAVKRTSCENTNASNNHNNEVISSLSDRAVLCSGVILARICNYPATQAVASIHTVWLLDQRPIFLRPATYDLQIQQASCDMLCVLTSNVEATGVAHGRQRISSHYPRYRTQASQDWNNTGQPGQQHWPPRSTTGESGPAFPASEHGSASPASGHGNVRHKSARRQAGRRSRTSLAPAGSMSPQYLP